VLDNGSAKAERKTVNGKMTYTAECDEVASCIRHPMGAPDPGDGDISVSCKMTHCTCEWDPKQGAKRTLAFENDKPCSDSDIARHLLLTRCGVQPAPEQ
jgi:hypothetical protein